MPGAVISELSNAARIIKPLDALGGRLTALKGDHREAGTRFHASC